MCVVCFASPMPIRVVEVLFRLVVGGGDDDGLSPGQVLHPYNAWVAGYTDTYVPSAFLPSLA
jgi:hypothetical protein